MRVLEAAACNCLFAFASQWWDVLCNLTTQEITLSKKYAAELATEEAKWDQNKTSVLDRKLKKTKQNFAFFLFCGKRHKQQPNEH